MNTTTMLRFALFVIIMIFPVITQAQNKTGTTAAPFLSIGTSARGTAMGGAFVAVADDESAMFWNPGGLATINKNLVSFSNAQWFIGTSFQDATAVINTGNSGNLGIRLMYLNYGDIDVTTIQNPEGTGERITPMDLSINLTYSRYLTTSFSFGATVKYVSQRIWNSTAGGVALDLGVLYRSDFKNFRIGMAITNFGSDMQMSGEDLKQAHDIAPDVNGNNDRLPVYLATNAWAMPLNFRVGVAMDVLEGNTNRLTVAVDAKQPSDNSSSLDVGAEYGFKNMVFFRGGYRSLFTEVVEDGGFTAGFGLNYDMNARNSFRVGYSYQYHERLGSPQIWTLSVTF